MLSSKSYSLTTLPLLPLAKYSFGIGDRFAHQSRPQLKACMMAAEHGVEIVPVWNKSNREHLIVGSEPSSVRVAAEAAVRDLGWKKPFHIDADHVTLETVGRFIQSSDFYTIDVADAIGKPVSLSEVDSFIHRHPELLEENVPAGIDSPLQLTREALARIANRYLFATTRAGQIYRHIAEAKGDANFVTEVSMDETESPQTPAELLVILAALADNGVPLQTIAPKFTGRFNKGVDYVGDTAQFDREFRNDLAVISKAVKTYGFPAQLKLSVHSGSDKFSIYPMIHRALRDTGAGIHVKTAGTTWLEELIGLAEAGGDGLNLAKEIYSEAYIHREELCAPYAAVIDIDSSKLPQPEQVRHWISEQYANALRHDRKCPEYNPSFRQLLHVGYKVAAKMGARYLNMLQACEGSISRNVIANLYERHIVPIFLGAEASPAARNRGGLRL
ncbi:MAG TPA: tagaturonate epimerase family protein [Terriglobales bacterium]|nr:tagaturonate epimerase family protein [Terriglobales bacterium]